MVYMTASAFDALSSIIQPWGFSKVWKIAKKVHYFDASIIINYDYNYELAVQIIILDILEKGLLSMSIFEHWRLGSSSCSAHLSSSISELLTVFDCIVVIGASSIFLQAFWPELLFVVVVYSSKDIPSSRHRINVMKMYQGHGEMNCAWDEAPLMLTAA